MKRSYPACPCQKDIEISSGGAFWTDLFLYSNGRCYAQYENPQNYAFSQLLCQGDASPHAGRLATFDSYSDYFAITSAMNGYIPGDGALGTWIGMQDQQWVDPNIPSCPPTFNLAQYQLCDAGFVIPATGTVGLGGAWKTWYAASDLIEGHMCEFGKKYNQFLFRKNKNKQYAVH